MEVCKSAYVRVWAHVSKKHVLCILLQQTTLHVQWQTSCNSQLKWSSIGRKYVMSVTWMSTTVDRIRSGMIIAKAVHCGCGASKSRNLKKKNTFGMIPSKFTIIIIYVETWRCQVATYTRTSRSWRHSPSHFDQFAGSPSEKITGSRSLPQFEAITSGYTSENSSTRPGWLGLFQNMHSCVFCNCLQGHGQTFKP